MIDISVKELPFLRYEYVDVAFTAANADLVVPYTRLRPDSPSDVRWIDVNQGGTGSGVAHVYRNIGSGSNQPAPGQIILRSSVAPYSTRLLLFLERS